MKVWVAPDNADIQYMLFNLFRRNKKRDNPYAHLPVPEKPDWSVLGADMHAHFLPGIDDGAKNAGETISLLQGMVGMGFTHSVATPHIMIDHHPNTTHTIRAAHDVALQLIKDNNIGIDLRAAAEYYMDDHFTKLLETEPLLTIQKNEVLVEFSMMFEPPILAQTLFNMQASGYKPIIAHPERYLFFHKNYDKYQELKDRGCYLQLNLLAISGYYGQHVKAIADRLLDEEMYDYCGSDAHNERHIAALAGLACSPDYHRIANYPFRNKTLTTIATK